MVPLRTVQGLDATELASRFGTREVMVWGTGDLAQDVHTSLVKGGFAVAAFLHDRPARGTFLGRPVLTAGDLLAGFGRPHRPFVILAAAAYRREAEHQCLAAGMRPGCDFLSHLEVSRPQAVVEVAGHGALMRADRFAATTARLSADLPRLCHIEFALASDPLLNPDLPGMVHLAEAVAPCTIVTRLEGTLPLASLLAAGPSRLDVVVGGVDAGAVPASIPPPGSPFRDRLDELGAALAGAPGATRAQVRLYRRRDDHRDVESGWRSLLRGSGIALSVATPYVMPYDEVLAYCETGAFPPAARAAADALPWDLGRGLALSLADAHLPCLSQRVFPVIRADGSVVSCHLYRGPCLAGDYLDVSWAELLERRHRAEGCRVCQRHGLHRLDLEVLRRRHPGNPPTAVLENHHVQA